MPHSIRLLAFTFCFLFTTPLFAQRKVEYLHPNGVLKESGKMRFGEKDGVWQEWNDKGAIINKTRYEKGKKIWEEMYNPRGGLRMKIDYQAAPGQALVRTYDSKGVCWHEHYGAVNKNRARTSYDHKGQIGCRMAFHVDNGQRHYFTHKNPLIRDHKIDLELPSYWWHKDGSIAQVRFGTNSLHWHDNGVLAQAEGFFEKGEDRIYYRWDKEGNQVDNRLKVMTENLADFDFALAKNYLKGDYVDGLPHGVWENYYCNGQLWYRQKFDRGKPTGEFESYYFNGNPHVKANLQKGIFHGAYTEWYSNGQMKATGFVDMGKIDGSWKIWMENGNLRLEQNYFKQQLHGRYSEYHYQTGKLIAERNYVKGKHSGIGYEYYPSGVLKKQVTYRDGYSSGRTLEYLENGQLKSDNYQGYGLQKRFHHNGQMYSLSYYAHDNGGTLNITWNDDGTLSAVNYDWGQGTFIRVNWRDGEKTIYAQVDNEEVKNPTVQHQFMLDTKLDIPTRYNYDDQRQLHGLCITYYPNNQVWLEEEYQNGQLHGTSKVYSIDGNLIEESHFQNDVREGMAKYWDNQGRPVREEWYKDGIKTGQWKEWHKASDQLKSTNFFTNGVSDGVYESFYPEGGRSGYSTMKNGIKHGLQEFYNYQKRYKTAEVYYVNGLRHGKATHFDEAGNVIRRGKFVNDKQHGTWRKYDAAGKVIGVDHYDYGVLIEKPLGLECECKVNYGNPSKRHYFSLLEHLATYKDFMEEVQDHFTVEEESYKYFFYRNYFTSGSSSRNNGWCSLEAISYKPINLRLKDLPGLSLGITPCLSGNQYSHTYLNISSYNPQRHPGKKDKKKWEYQVDTQIDQLALDFPVEMLTQWDSEKDKPMKPEGQELGARLLFGIKEVSYTSDQGLAFNGQHSFCFSEALIKKANMTIDFEDAQVHLLSDKEFARGDAFTLHNKHLPKKSAGVFVPEANGIFYIGKKKLPITYQNVFLRDDKIVGTIVLDQEKEVQDKIHEEAHKRFEAVTTTRIEGLRVLHFVYNK